MSKRSLAKTIISMMLCCIMMMAPVMPSFAAEGNDATLSDLRFNDLIVLEFDKDTLSYEAVFPYDNATGAYYVPGITATPTDPEATVDIAYPDDITCGAITVTVTAANGLIEQTYEITPTAVGENLYYAGDFEANDAPTYWRSDNAVSLQFTSNSEDVKAGSKAMIATSTGDGWLYGKVKSGFSKDKMYYGMVDAKLVSSATQSSFEAYNRTSGISANGTLVYYLNGTNMASTNKFSLSKSWQRAAFTFAATNDVSITEFKTTPNPWGTQPATALDNYYVGELAVAKVAVTDETGSIAVALTEEDLAEDKTITLSKEVLNSAGNSDGLENATFTEWKVAPETAGITVSPDGVVTVPANTPAGTYLVEAYYNLTNTGITHSQKTNGVRGVYTIQVSGGAKTLASITAEPAYIEVQDGDYSYDLYLPVKQVNGADTYSMPEISAVTVDPSHTVEVTYPAQAAEGEIATLTVKSADGATVDIYTLTFKFIGENLYAVKGFEESNIRISNSGLHVINAGSGVEQWYTTNVTSVQLVTDEVKTGDRALKLTSKNISALWNGKLTTDGGLLRADKTYYASVDAKIAASEEKDSITSLYRVFDKTTEKDAENAAYYIDGIKQNDNSSEITKNWKNYSASFAPTTAYSFYHYFKNWSETQPAFVLDNYYVGELVVADVAIEAGEFGDSILLNEDGETEIQLTAKAINQFGNNSGLEAATLTEMTLVDAPQGVTLENGTLTIAEGAAVDEITVYVAMEPKHTGTLQSKVAGTVELAVLNPNISYSADAISAGSIESRIAFVSNIDAEIFFVTALYEKADDNTLKLINAVPKTGTLKTGKLYSDKQTVTVPNDGKTYVIKSFVWNATTLQPLMGEGLLQ